jgi:DNA repair exonuclease SbcCD ATPase subunit
VDDILVMAKGGSDERRRIEKSIRSLQERVAEHEAKLEQYRRNPDAYDNQGTLKSAPSQEARRRIIEGRIRKLEKEIEKFRKEIERLQRQI